MGDSVLADVEATAAVAGVGVVAGTLPAAAMQFADLSESGSDSGDDVSTDLSNMQQQQHEQTPENGTSGAGHLSQSARSSPPPNCAICLSRCRRKCFTDSCMHQFCFKCLCEWSKIKPECPLCKQPFKTIIHNVRTLDDYDRYAVESNTPLDHSAVSFHIVNVRRRRLMLENQGIVTHEIDTASADDTQDIFMHPTRMQFNRFEPYRGELLNFYRNERDSGGTVSLSQLWRRYVYDRKLYALPVCDSYTGQFREWSARFYRDNPAQMHRLMPWINRDIVCLLRNFPQSVSEVMRLMHDILPVINIPTRTFRRRLSPYLGGRTNHFIHELFNFARSPYDMIGYDRVVQYSARVAQEVEVDLLDVVPNNQGNVPLTSRDSIASPIGNGIGRGVAGVGGVSVSGDGVGVGSINVGNNETDDITESASDWSRLPRPSTSVIVTNPSATHSFSVTMATDGSELPGISIRRTTTSNVGSQTVAINLSMRRPASEVIEIDDGDAAANAEVAAINDGSSSQTSRRQASDSLPVTAHIDLESSDSSNSSDEDECIFVLERKPPHLRTPELVSLDSSDDSDVVFVDEEKPSTPPKLSGSDNSGRSAADDIEAGASENANASVDMQSVEHLFMGPSTSTGMLSTSGKNWKRVLEVTRRQDALRKCTIPRVRLRNLESIGVATAASSRSSSDTNWNNSSKSSSSSSSSSSGASSTCSSSSDEESKEKLRKRRPQRNTKTRRRVANSKPGHQPKSKRRRKVQPKEVQPPQHEDKEKAMEKEKEKEKKRQPRRKRRKTTSSSSSSSSEDESSKHSCPGAGKRTKRTNSCSSSDESNSSDDDSSDNLVLSTLREHIKVEVRSSTRETEGPSGASQEEEHHHHRHYQHEQQEQKEEIDLKSSSSHKRRPSNSSNSNLSSHSSSQSPASTMDAEAQLGIYWEDGNNHNYIIDVVNSSLLRMFNAREQEQQPEAAAEQRVELMNQQLHENDVQVDDEDVQVDDEDVQVDEEDVEVDEEDVEVDEEEEEEEHDSTDDAEDSQPAETEEASESE